MNKYKFEIVPANWFKRRTPRPEPKPIKVVKIDDFQLVENHFCTMHVEYDDGNVKEYLSRVMFSEYSEKWLVDGMHVYVEVVFEEEDKSTN
jgi:hypothetical protein